MKINPQQYIDNLADILGPPGKIAVAFSGGLDSSTLLAVADSILPGRVTALTAVTPAISSADMESASQVIDYLDVPWIKIDIDILSIPEIKMNTGNRCYHCKLWIYKRFLGIVMENDLGTLIEGSNIDDLNEHRPGTRAVNELGVQSPLIDAGLGKGEIGEIAGYLNLPVANRPPSPCLLTRIPYDTNVTLEMLHRIDCAEEFLRRLGVGIVRVRDYGSTAHIDINPDDLDKIVEHMTAISDKLTDLGWGEISLDPDGYRPGRFDNMNDIGRK